MPTLETAANESKICEYCQRSFTAADLKIPRNFKRQRYCDRRCMLSSYAFTHQEAVDAFWKRVDKSGECWLFMGARDKWGYGDLSFLRKHVQAHRLAWRLLRSEPGKMDVLHKCNNPPCCNPDHLYLGTDFDNAKDRIKAGRHRRGEDVPGSKLTVEKVREMRRLKAETGISFYKLGPMFGVSYSTARYICIGRTWKSA